MLRIRLVRSPIGDTAHARRIVRALGLRKMNGAVLQPDNPSIRGMIHRIKHMLEFEVVEGVEKRAKSRPKGARTPKAAKPTPKAKQAPRMKEAQPADIPVEEMPKAPKAEKPVAKTAPKSASKPAASKKPAAKKPAPKPKAAKK